MTKFFKMILLSTFTYFKWMDIKSKINLLADTLRLYGVVVITNMFHSDSISIINVAYIVTNFFIIKWSSYVTIKYCFQDSRNNYFEYIWYIPIYASTLVYNIIRLHDNF